MTSSQHKVVVKSWSLAVRMVLVAVLTPLIALGLLVALVLVAPPHILIGVAVALAVGVSIQVGRFRKRRHPDGRVLARGDDPELFALVDRLCALAEVPAPELVLRAERQPNSWVVHLPGSRPRLYLTTGLRELLTPDELAAVIAHELSHIANRDALVMSVVGMPGAVMLGARRAFTFDGLPVVAIGMIANVGTSILGRYREFAADAGSAAITGRPSALASALMKVSDSLDQIPAGDLRAAAALNAFNLVPIETAKRRPRRAGDWEPRDHASWGPAWTASRGPTGNAGPRPNPRPDATTREEPHGATAAPPLRATARRLPNRRPGLVRRITATHPPLAQRLRALAELEQALQSR